MYSLVHDPWTNRLGANVEEIQARCIGRVYFSSVRVINPLRLVRIMPIETKLLPGLIWITISGDVLAGEFCLHASELERIESGCDVSPNRFTDLSENVSHPSYEAMSNFAVVRTVAMLKNKVKSAVFAPSDYQFGMARMFQGLNFNPEIEVRVFRDKAEALEWVGWVSPENPKT